MKGFAHLLLLLLLAGGLAVGVYLVQTQQIFRSRASISPIEFTGPSVSERNGQKVTNALSLNIRLTSPIQQLSDNSAGEGGGVPLPPPPPVNPGPPPVPPASPGGGSVGGRQPQSAFVDRFNDNKYGISFGGKVGQENIGLPTPVPVYAYGVGGTNPIQTLSDCENDHSPCLGRINGVPHILVDKNDTDLAKSETVGSLRFTKGEKKLYDIVKASPDTYWALFNEPDLYGNINIGQTNFIERFTGNQYAQAFKKMNDVVKAADPNAKLMFGGMAANVDYFKAFITDSINAYGNLYQTTMPIDIWSFHAYPNRGEASCEDPQVYEAGLIHTKNLVNKFLDHVDTVQAGNYRNIPVWLTEWGWIRNPEGRPHVTKNVNTPCVSKYIKDVVNYLETDTRAKSRITRVLYFPAGDAKVRTDYWCDHNLGNFIKDGALKTSFLEDKQEWQCWAGFLTEDGQVTQPGRTYGCIATAVKNGTSLNNCVIPASGPDIKETRVFQTVVGGNGVDAFFRDCSVDLASGGMSSLGDPFAPDPNSCKYFANNLLLNDSRYGGGLDVNSLVYYEKNGQPKAYQLIVGKDKSAYYRECDLDPNRGPWAMGDGFNSGNSCRWSGPYDLGGDPIYGAKELSSAVYKRGEQQRIYQILVSGNGRRLWYRDCSFNPDGGQNPWNIGNGFAANAVCKWEGGYENPGNVHGGSAEVVNVTAYQLGPVWRASQIIVGGDKRMYYRDCEFDTNRGPSSMGDGFREGSNCPFGTSFSIDDPRTKNGMTEASYLIYTRTRRSSQSVLGITTQAQAQSTPPTVSFKISESALTDAEWNGLTIQSYTRDGIEIPITFSSSSPGVKTIFVQFIARDGRKEVRQASITYEPPVTVAGYVYLDGNGNAGFNDGENSRTHASIINNVEVRFTSQQDNSITGSVRTQNDDGQSSGFYQINIPQNAINHTFTVSIAPPSGYRNAGEVQYGVALGGSSKTQHIGIAPTPLAACSTVAVPQAVNGSLPASLTYPVIEVPNVQRASNVQFYLYKGSVSADNLITEMPQETITGTTYKRTIDMGDLTRNKGINTANPLVITAIAVDAAGQQTSCGQTTITIPRPGVPISGPLPTPPSCILAGNDGSEISFRWTGSDVTQLEMSTSPTFPNGNVFIKSVTGINSTNAQGFVNRDAPTDTAFYAPDRTYYFRSTDGTRRSSGFVVNIPACATPSPSLSPSSSAAVVQFTGYTVTEDRTIRDSSTIPQTLASSGTSLDFKLSVGAGIKTIFIRFFYSDGTFKDSQQSVILKDPATPTTSQVISDNFNGGNSENTLGSQWTAINATFGVQNGQAYIVSGCPAPGYALLETGKTDGRLEVTITKNKQDARMPFRYQDSNNYYWVEALGNGYELAKLSSGTKTTLATNNTSPADNHRIKIEFSGPRIDVYLNGNKIMTASDGSVTGSRHGIGTWCDTTMRFDNFSFDSN